MEQNEIIEEEMNPLSKAAFAYCVGIIIALFVLRVSQKPFAFYGAVRGEDLFFGKDPAVGLLWALGIGTALTAIGEISTRFTRWGRAIARMLRQVIGHLHPLDALLLALLSAVGEELLFRGVLLPFAGLFGSSIIFGLLHLVPRKGLWVWSLWALGAGLCLGWLAIETGGILAPAAAHFLVNFAGLLTVGRRKL